jgi:GxxExxY protein
MRVERQKPAALEFHGLRIDDAFRLALLVEGSVVVELKPVQRLAPVHMKRTLTYLPLLGIPLGFLINSSAFRLKDGIHRLVVGYRPARSRRSWRETEVPVPREDAGQ